jgi:hypothetical protein
MTGGRRRRGSRAFRTQGERFVIVVMGMMAMCSQSYGEDTLPDYELSRIPVDQRPHPEFDPVGYRFGQFMFYPRISAGLLYNSNVFAANANAQSDAVARFSPGLNVQYGKLPTSFNTGTPGFSADLDLGADLYRYRQFSSENRTDAHASLKTHWDIANDLKLDTTAEIARKHEERGEPSSPLNAAEPVPYLDIRGDSTLTKTFGRFGVAVNGAVRRLSYEDVNAVDGSVLDQSSRSGTIVSTFVRPYYEFSPGYQLFMRAAANARRYAGEGDLNRDSNGYNITAGLAFTMTPLISGSVEAGYLSQSYENPTIAPVSGASFKAEAMWLATSLLTIRAGAERRVAETVSPDYDSRLDTNFMVRADYELLRNVTLFAGATYSHQKFEGLQSRTDKVAKFSLGGRYALNRTWSLDGRYDFIDRNSSLPNFTFDQHVVMFNVTAQH